MIGLILSVELESLADLRDELVVAVPACCDERTLRVDGLFLAIGHVPNSALFKEWLDLDDQGYIVTDGLTRTNVAGVFAAGDVADPHFRQAITAAGTGCAAAMQAERYLDSLDA